MSDEALKPCPFCGEQCATLVIDQGDKWAHYEPSCLEVRTGYDLSDDAAWRAEAISAWNTRADDDRIEALQADKAKLREALRVYAGPMEWSEEPYWGAFPVWADGYPGGVYLGDNTLDFGEAARAALQETER